MMMNYIKYKEIILKFIKKCSFVDYYAKIVVRFIMRSLTRISPVLNTKVLYFFKFGRKLNLNNPVSFNEKLLKLKLDSYETNPLIRKCADKYAVRDYINEKGCSELLNDLIACYDNVDDINWSLLPPQFALKLSYGCGFNILCSDKSKLDIPKVITQIKKWDKRDYYLDYSELQYKNTKHTIIIEKYLKTNDADCIDDYKVYCFNGRPKIILVCKERTDHGAKYFYYDTSWNLLRLEINDEFVENEYTEKPAQLEKLLYYAEVLSEPFKFVRADFYLINDKIYFGELTFTPCGCMDTAYKEESDIYLGSLLQL